MKAKAVGFVTILFILMGSDANAAGRIPYQTQMQHIARGDWRPEILLAANETVLLPIKQLEGSSGVPIYLKLYAPVKNLKFVMFRGIPPDIKFSSGFMTDKNWLVSIDDLERTALISTQNTIEPVTFEVLYFRDSKQKPIARGLIIVNFNEHAPVEGGLVHEETQDQPGTSTTSINIDDKMDLPSNIPAISSEQEDSDLEQARDFLRNGDISSARRILEFLASQGSGKGARLLAETYDPAYLQELTTAGLLPDIERARQWYKRAEELGDDQAAKRLSILAGH